MNTDVDRITDGPVRSWLMGGGWTSHAVSAVKPIYGTFNPPKKAPLADLFTVTRPTALAPRPAKILDSLTCSACGESTMESRTRRFAGETYCIPCFADVEQKV